MASTTPNIGLTLPTGTEKVSRQVINTNNTKIDTAIGTLNSNFMYIFTRKYRTYTNITIPSSEYIKVDSYSEMDVSTDLYLISMNVRGWTGSINGVMIAKSSSGTEFYLIGEANIIISSITVEYIFSRY